jgi:hypothetical protein
MGGIGDQIFQFSFANYLKKKLDCNIYLDISYYQSSHNYNKFNFFLKKVAIKNNFLLVTKSFLFDYRFLSYLRIFQILKIDKVIPQIYSLFFNIDIRKFIYQFWKGGKKFKISYNSFYFGYWHKIKYVKKVKNDLYKYFIKEIIKKNKINNFIQKNIDSKTIAIHIRGGDFAYLKSHNLLNENYYDKGIFYFNKKFNKPKFHIFTNDIKFAKKILKKHSSKNKIVYIKKYNFSDDQEFCLFSCYTYAIIANSTFSYMSSYLSKSRIISIAPKIWLLGKRLEKEKRFDKLYFI